MTVASLPWVNVFVDDLDTLPAFYMDVFGFTEIDAMRNAVFRGVATGRSNIGFMAPEVYGILNLEAHAEHTGVRFLLNIDVSSTDAVDELTGVAVERGATLVKAPTMTSYGWYQAALLDPEGNVFRINTVVEGPTF
jgi:predicted enzyme related to lactoylglutathione lyase